MSHIETKIMSERPVELSYSGGVHRAVYRCGAIGEYSVVRGTISLGPITLTANDKPGPIIQIKVASSGILVPGEVRAALSKFDPEMVKEMVYLGHEDGDHARTRMPDGHEIIITQYERTTVEAVVHDGPALSERWKFEFHRVGAHVHVTVRSGQPGSRALLGTLTMTEEEASELEAVVKHAGAHVGELE